MAQQAWLLSPLDAGIYTDAYYLLLLPSYSASLVEEWEINNHPKKINLYKKKRIEVGYVKFVKEN